MSRKGRVRRYGNDVIDSLPPLLQDWVHAITSGDLTWAKECASKDVDVNARIDPYGGTALFLAIELAHVSLIRWLVEEAHVDIEVVDYGGYNALDYVAACGYHHSVGADTLDIASYLKARSFFPVKSSELQEPGMTCRLGGSTKRTKASPIIRKGELTSRHCASVSLWGQVVKYGGLGHCHGQNQARGQGRDHCQVKFKLLVGCPRSALWSKFLFVFS